MLARFSPARFLSVLGTTGLLVVVLAFSLAAPLAAQPPPSGDTLWIEGVTVVSPHLPAPLAGQNVLVVDGRVRRVSPEPVRTSGDAVWIDGQGRFLTPGLMDSHAHVSLIPGLGFWGDEQAVAHPDLAAAYLDQQPRSLLYHGVTQVLDPNPGTAWERFVAAPERPDYVRCEVVASPRTYPMAELPAAEARARFPYFVREGAGGGDRHTPEAVVERIAEAGARCVKLYFEDGYGDDARWPLLRPETVARILRAAHARGLPVVAHANAVDMAEAALRAGVDVLAHGLWNWGAANGEPGVPPSVAAVLDRVARDGVGFMPTQRTIGGLADVMEPAPLDDPAFVAVTPPALRAWYAEPEAEWFRDEVVAGFGGDLAPEQVAALFRHRHADRNRRALVYLHAAGHSLLLGSDTPGSPTYANQPGLTTYRELVALAGAGVPLADVLAAATLHNARAFGLDADYGTVEAGKVANLLLLRANPLESVVAWDAIETVILHGRPIERASLRAAD